MGQIPDAIWIVLISILGGSVFAPLVTLVWNKVFNRNKDGTDLAQTALNIANQAATELGEAREKITALESADERAKQDRLLLREYMRGTKILIGQLEDRDITPLWYPPTEYANIMDESPTQPDKRPQRKSGGFGMRR